MALHRDIHWIGRQWAVTGYGMQAIDQRLGGRFDIEIERLWDQGLPEILSEQKWFNADDFSKGLVIARKRYPGVLRAPEPAPPPASEPAPSPMPTPLPVETIMKASAVVASPPKAVEAAKPEEAAKAEPVTPPKPAPPEDLLGKWFDTFGISKTDSPAPTARPESPRQAIPPVPEQAVLPDEADEATKRSCFPRRSSRPSKLQRLLRAPSNRRHRLLTCRSQDAPGLCGRGGIGLSNFSRASRARAG